MTKKNTLLYIITNIAIFIPAPAFVGYGLILILGLIVVFSSSIFFGSYIESLDKEYRMPLLLIGAGIITTLYHQAISFFSPAIGLTLGFIIYLIPLSILGFDAVLVIKTDTSKQKQKESFKILAVLSLLSLFFFILREFLAFGTISYPTMSGIEMIQLPITFFEGFAFFWSSIPGALVIVTLFMVFLPLLQKKDPEVIKEEEV